MAGRAGETCRNWRAGGVDSTAPTLTANMEASPWTKPGTALPRRSGWRDRQRRGQRFGRPACLRSCGSDLCQAPLSLIKRKTGSSPGKIVETVRKAVGPGIMAKLKGDPVRRVGTGGCNRDGQLA